MDIADKTAIITGATGALGAEMVKRIAGGRANCICIYNRSKSRADKLQAELKNHGSESVFIQADISKPAGVEKIFSEIENFAVPEILINSAAVFEKKTIDNVTADYIKETFDINFSAAILMIQKFAALAKANNKKMAKIINITDAGIEKPAAGFSVYTASKSALVSATKTLAKELGPEFTVNAVGPGIIDWPKNLDAKIKDKVMANIPAKRFGSYSEVVSAVMFILENDYINGQIINVDGGRGL